MLQQYWCLQMFQKLKAFLDSLFVTEVMETIVSFLVRSCISSSSASEMEALLKIVKVQNYFNSKSTKIPKLII